MQGYVIYRSKYGSTSQYAAWLSQQLKLPIADAGSRHQPYKKACDFFVIGSPVYIGKLMIRSWLRRNENLLHGKQLFFFIVCGTPKEEKEKVAKIIRDNIPNTLLAKSTVFFLPGRLVRKQLSWLDGLLLKMGARFEPDREAAKRMLTDFDGVNESELKILMDSITKYQSQSVAGMAH